MSGDGDTQMGGEYLSGYDAICKRRRYGVTESHMFWCVRERFTIQNIMFCPHVTQSLYSDHSDHRASAGSIRGLVTERDHGEADPPLLP